MSTFADRWRGRARSLAVFGDSITAGSLASAPERRWPNLLAERIGVERLANKGISGTVLQNSPGAGGSPRADNGLSRHARDLLGDERAEVVAILYGFNDARYTAAPHTLNHEGFKRDYGMLLDALFGAGFNGDAICLGSPPHIPDAGFAVGADDGFAGQSRVEFQRYVRTLELLARGAGTFYAPVNEWMSARGADDLVSPDQVHPNDAGHAAIAEAFANAIFLGDRYLK